MYIYVCVHAALWLCTSTYVYMPPCGYVHLRMYVYMPPCGYVHLRMYVYMPPCGYVHLRMYVYMPPCGYVHLHMCTCRPVVMYIYVCVHAALWLCISTYVYMPPCGYVHLHMCTCVHRDEALDKYGLHNYHGAPVSVFVCLPACCTHTYFCILLHVSCMKSNN